MRHVIYLLLVANIVFFGWQTVESRNQDEDARALPGLPVTARPIVTLQEMEQGQAQQQAPEPGAKPESDPNPDPGPGVEETIEPLALVEELTELQPPGGGGAITCRTLGPIMAVAQLKSLSSRLDELGLEPRHRTSEIQEADSYWVYLPAMEYSRAQEISRKLEAHNDNDYYIGKGNFISLGTFKEQDRAEVRMRQVSKLDLDPVIEPRYATQTVHWLDIDRRTSHAVDLGSVMQDYPEIRLQEQACY